MEIETFELRTETGDPEVLEDLYSDEAEELIDLLGLEGQRSLRAERTTDGGDTTKVTNPYRLMTREEQAIYSAILTETKRLKTYDSGPVPLRVMQIAAHASSVIPNMELEVWQVPDAAAGDPLLVGRVSEKYTAKFYMLARWGDALIPLEELRITAFRNLKAKAALQIKEIESSLSGIKQRLDEMIENHLRGADARLPFIHSVSFDIHR